MTHDQAVELIAQRVLHWIVSDADFSDYRIYFEYDQLTDANWAEITVRIQQKSAAVDKMEDLGWACDALTAERTP